MLGTAFRLTTLKAQTQRPRGSLAPTDAVQDIDGDCA